MDGKQLKNSILQWAIQGKLVPQDPKDEPASVLLEKIRKEKERLVKEGKLKKKDLEVKPIEEDEKPFEIPEGWVWCRLGELIFPPKYGTSSKSSSSGEMIVLRMGNIQDGEIAYDKLVYSNDEVDNEKYLLKKNDLLFNRTNSAELVGKTAIYRGDKPAIYAGYLILLRMLCEDIAEYTNFVLGSPYARDFCKDVKTIGVQQCNINAEKISLFAIPLPPLAEQKRIVKKLEQILPLVEEYGKAQNQLDNLNKQLPEALKKSILQEAIQGKLVPQNPNDEPASALLAKIRQEKERLVKEGKFKKKDLEVKPIEEDEVPFEIPEGWAWCRLSSLALMYTGNSISETEKKSKFLNVVGREYIGTKDVGFNHVVDYKNGVFIPEQYQADFRIAPKNAILMCVEGGSAGRKIAIVNKDVCFGNKLCCFSAFGDYSKYLYYYLQSPAFFDTFSDSKTGIIGGVSLNTLKDLLIPFPSFAEQKRIVAKLEQLFKVI